MIRRKSIATATTAGGPKRVFMGAFNVDIVNELKGKLANLYDTPRLELNEEQAAFCQEVLHGTGDIILRARAGTGKTTTGIQSLLRLPSVAAETATLHSVGLAAWRRRAPNCKVEKDKTSLLIEEWIASGPESRKNQVWDVGWGFIKKLVAAIKLSGAALNGSSVAKEDVYRIAEDYELEPAQGDAFPGCPEYDAGIDIALHIFNESIARDTEIIDFDDMLHAPILHRAPFNEYDLVYIDEAQDQSLLRKKISYAIAGNSGRLISIGDPAQAIYLFAGAAGGILDIIQVERGAKVLPLNTTYRCPHKVVALAQQWVPDYRAAPSNPQGEVRSESYEQFLKSVIDDPSHLPPTSGILCRNNRPLMQLATTLFRQGIPCKIRGRDLGQDMIGLMSKWKTNSVSQMIDYLGAYADRKAAYIEKTEKSKTKAQMKVEEIRDKIGGLTDFLQGLLGRNIRTVSDAKAEIDRMFVAKPAGHVPTLSTVHKAKGLEWEDTYILGRAAYMPSKMSKKSKNPDVKQQEKNLMYVAVTRSKNKLTDLEVME